MVGSSSSTARSLRTPVLGVDDLGTPPGVGVLGVDGGRLLCTLL